MSIKIKQNQNKYKLIIDDEEWEFENRKDMEAGLKTLLDMKDKKGKINNRNND